MPAWAASATGCAPAHRRGARRRAGAARRRGAPHPQLARAAARRPRLRSRGRALDALRAAGGRVSGSRDRRADASRLAEAAAQIPGGDGRGDLDAGADGRRRQRQRPHPRGRRVRPPERDRQPAAHGHAGYFETMGIPIVKGRGLTDADRQGALKVMVISEALARAAFPGSGSDRQTNRVLRVRTGRQEPRTTRSVVGVAGDVRSRALGRGAVARVLSADRSGSGRRLGLDSAHGLHRRADDSRSPGDGRPGAPHRQQASRQGSRCFR